MYVDDMLVKSRVASNHLDHLAEMFDILRKYGMKLNPLKCSFGVESGKFLGFIVSARGIKANPDQISALRKVVAPRSKTELQSLNGKVAALSRFISKATDKCIPFFDALKKGKKNFEWTEACQKAFDELLKHMETPPVLSKPVEGEDLYLSRITPCFERSTRSRRSESTTSCLLHQQTLFWGREELPEDRKVGLLLTHSLHKAKTILLSASYSCPDRPTLEAGPVPPRNIW